MRPHIFQGSSPTGKTSFSALKRIQLAQRLDVIFIVSMWVFLIACVIGMGHVMPVSVSFGTIALLLAAVLVFVVPALIIPVNRRMPSNMSELTSVRYKYVGSFTIIILSAFVFSGYLVEYLANPGANAGTLTLEEARQEHLQYGSQQGFASYYAIICKMLLPLNVILLWGKDIKMYARVTAVMIILSSIGLESLTTGGRVSLQLAIIVFVASSLVIARYLIAMKLWRFATIGVASLLAMIAANSAFNYLRSGRTDPVRDFAFIEAGDSALRSVGISEAPYAVSYATTLFLVYLVYPIPYFDYFIETYEGDPAYGRFQFSFIANRTGYDGMRQKLEIDELYALIGVNYNIWATGFREMIVDTGKVLFVPVMLLLGVVFALLKRYENRLLGLRMLYIFALSWLIASPFYSLLKARPFEFAVYFAFLVLAFELLTNQSLIAYSYDRDNPIPNARPNQPLRKRPAPIG